MDFYSTLAIVSIAFMIILFGLLVLQLVGKWKVFAKLDMPGWWSIIPVWGDWKLCERVHDDDMFNKAYLIVLICSVVLCWAPFINSLLLLACFIMSIIVTNDMAREFGKETGYTIGLVLLGCVFWPMLGCGSSEVVGEYEDDEDDLEDDEDADEWDDGDMPDDELFS